jgi:hypothetical protein
MSITTGHPQSCGSGSGGSGGTLYSFATYFQGQAGVPLWYYLSVTTDPVGQYRGPGTYPAHAIVAPVGADGPAAPIFDGQVQLTVKADRGVQGGSVDGVLRWVDDPTSSIDLGGDWSCQFGPQLGPG